jgi:hypothetical protein
MHTWTSAPLAFLAQNLKASHTMPMGFGKKRESTPCPYFCRLAKVKMSNARFLGAPKGEDRVTDGSGGGIRGSDVVEKRNKAYAWHLQQHIASYTSVLLRCSGVWVLILLFNVCQQSSLHHIHFQNTERSLSDTDVLVSFATKRKTWYTWRLGRLFPLSFKRNTK